MLRPNNLSEVRYNAAHCRTRNVVERAFGCLKKRFPCSKTLQNPPDTCVVTIIAAFVLHNFCILNKDTFDTDLPNDDTEVHQLPNANQKNGLQYRRMFIQQHFA